MIRDENKCQIQFLAGNKFENKFVEIITNGAPTSSFVCSGCKDKKDAATFSLSPKTVFTKYVDDDLVKFFGTAASSPCYIECRKI